MADHQIRFNDGASYEQMMGKWSRLAGDVFLDWIKAGNSLRWVDVGCGNGAFTELAIERCSPKSIDGIDPSEGQLSFARGRAGAKSARFHQGDAMALPFADASFDVAVMALVIFFVPDPAKGVAELVRVAAPGGLVAAYAWDIPGGGFPMEPMLAELRAMGFTPPNPPQVDIARIEALEATWAGAGLQGVETRSITVQRSFASFDDYWATNLLASTIGPLVADMTKTEAASLRDRVRARVPSDAAGRIAHEARANAVKGWVRA